MFGFFGFGRIWRAKDQGPTAEARTEASGRRSKNSEMQFEMIRLALNRVLWRHGIASQSVGCELAPMNRAGVPDVMLAQFVVFKWHEALMRYAPYLQNELFNEIRVFDNSVRASDFLFVWRFAIDSADSGGLRPESIFWTATQGLQSQALRMPAESALKVGTMAGQKIIFDLPKSALDHDDDYGHDDGFPATEITTH